MMIPTRLCGLLLVGLSALASAQVSRNAAPSTVAAVPAFDMAVARRAAQLISSPGAWTRDDGKDCAANATTFSLRCALDRAAQEAAGRAVASATSGAAPIAAPVTCTVGREGSCGPLFDDLPVLFAVEREPAITTGVWRTDAHPTQVWAGKSIDAVAPVMQQARRLVDSLAPKQYASRLIDYNNDSAMTLPRIQAFLRMLESRLGHETPAMLTADSPDDFELELYAGDRGVIRTYNGWFAVSRFSSRDSTLRFQIDTSREVAPSSVDREILRRADAMLSSDAVWNRADDRNCPAGATKWSIYCALHDASIEVAGGFHHRRPALELVRVIVEDRTKGKAYHHRLMDYNNDSTTHLSDVRSLFAEALARIK